MLKNYFPYLFSHDGQSRTYFSMSIFPSVSCTYLLSFYILHLFSQSFYSRKLMSSQKKWPEPYNNLCVFDIFTFCTYLCLPNRSWGCLGHFGVAWDHFLPSLGSSWAPLGPPLASLGALLAPLGRLLAPLGRLLAPLGCLLAPRSLQLPPRCLPEASQIPSRCPQKHPDAPRSLQMPPRGPLKLTLFSQ